MGKVVARLALLACAGVFVVGVAPANAGEGTLGTTTEGADKAQLNANTIFGNVYTLEESGTAVSFSAYVRGGDKTQVFKPVVYSVGGGGDETSAAGNEWTLVAAGEQVTVDKSAGPGWVTVPIAASLEPGRYLVGVLVGDKNDGARFFYVEGGTLVKVPNAYGEPTQSFSEPTLGSGKTLSMYVRLAGAGWGGASPRAARAPDRAGYCLDGRFLDLVSGQGAVDPTYAGAIPAYYVEGKGITCDAPTGLTYSGLYYGPDAVWGFYPYFK